MINHEKRLLSFFPELSPWPFQPNGTPDRKSSLRLFNKKMFEKTPHLFLFGQTGAFYDKKAQTWRVFPLKENRPQKLPWMEFELTLLKHTSEIPTLRPVYTTPLQKDNKVSPGKPHRHSSSSRPKNPLGHSRHSPSNLPPRRTRRSSTLKGLSQNPL